MARKPTKAQLQAELDGLREKLAGSWTQRLRQQGKVEIAGLSPVAKARLQWDTWSAVSEVFGYTTQVLPDSILPLFAQELHHRLKLVPIQTNPVVRTASALTLRFTPNPIVFISPLFWAFLPAFQFDLLTHEFLHILEAESGQDINRFYADVQAWYNSGDDNYVKQTLRHYLYSDSTAPEHQVTKRGVEEFAFIGKLLAQDARWHDAVPGNIRAYYKDILAEEIWQ